MRSPVTIIGAIIFTIASSILLAIALPQSSHGFSSGGPSLTTIEGNPLCPGPPSANGVLTFNAGQFCDSQSLGSTLTGFQFTLSGGSGSGSVAAATTNWVGLPGINAPTGTEANARTLINNTCTASNLDIGQSTAANANVPVYTFRVNGASTALTCTITNGNFGCSDGTHSAAVAANATFTLQIANPASANATGNIFWSVLFRC